MYTQGSRPTALANGRAARLEFVLLQTSDPQRQLLLWKSYVFVEGTVHRMKKLRCLLIIGTRPEVIKMAPVVHACCAQGGGVEPIVCSTGQHEQLQAGLFEHFEIAPSIHLRLMKPDQATGQLAARCLEYVDRVVADKKPDCVVAQGDTTTVLAASTAAFFRRVPFVHVEAGMRTHDLNAPWPEEFNRRVATLATSLHCAPTRTAADNLLHEGVDPSSIHVTGSTIVDALQWTARHERSGERIWKRRDKSTDRARLVLITGHRRENFGKRFEEVLRAIKSLAEAFPDVAFVYPVHLNPNVHEPAHQLLDGHENIDLIEPLTYPEFVGLMREATFVLSDSGGIQEEASVLGKRVLVTRDVTERPETVEAGFAELIGCSAERIVERATALLEPAPRPASSFGCSEPSSDRGLYGDGKAGPRIVELMLRRFAR